MNSTATGPPRAGHYDRVVSRHATTGDPASFYSGSDNLSRAALLSREPLGHPPLTPGLSVVLTGVVPAEQESVIRDAFAAATGTDVDVVVPPRDWTGGGRSALVAGRVRREWILFWDPDLGLDAAAELVPALTDSMRDGVDLVVAGVAITLNAGAGHSITCDVSGDAGPVSVGSGPALLVRTARFAGMGGFDEQLPVAYRALDLALRFVRAGLTVAVVPLPEGCARAPAPDTIDDPVFRRRWWSYLAARALVGA